jgi:hypothetical protein
MLPNQKQSTSPYVPIYKHLNQVLGANPKLPVEVEWNSPSKGVLITSIDKIVPNPDGTNTYFHNGKFRTVDGRDVSNAITFNSFTDTHARFRIYVPAQRAIPEILEEKGMGVKIKKRGDHKCTCDFYKVILVEGCQCNGW